MTIDGSDILSLAPYDRPVKPFFRNHALFPHMTVAEKIGFGLEMQNRPKAEIKSVVGEMLELVKMTPMADRMTSERSGGQQQRVALARALVPRPKVLLLDEPLSLPAMANGELNIYSWRNYSSPDLISKMNDVMALAVQYCGDARLPCTAASYFGG